MGYCVSMNVMLLHQITVHRDSCTRCTHQHAEDRQNMDDIISQLRRLSCDFDQPVDQRVCAPVQSNLYPQASGLL